MRTHLKATLGGMSLILLMVSYSWQRESRPATRVADSDKLPLGLLDISHNVGSCLRTAEALQGMGKDKAVERLRQLAAADDDKCSPFSTVVLCRMLFKAKNKGDFRRAALGQPVFWAGDMGDWPLEPIAIANGVPFVVTRGYVLKGLPEPARDYVEYCSAECDWNDFRYKASSNGEQRQALEKLLASLPWMHRIDDLREALARQLD